jgi:hypothetical protein
MDIEGSFFGEMNPSFQLIPGLSQNHCRVVWPKTGGKAEILSTWRADAGMARARALRSGPCCRRGGISSTRNLARKR